MLSFYFEKDVRRTYSSFHFFQQFVCDNPNRSSADHQGLYEDQPRPVLPSFASFSASSTTRAAVFVASAPKTHDQERFILMKRVFIFVATTMLSPEFYLYMQN
jgi:hypothetical protein